MVMHGQRLLEDHEKLKIERLSREPGIKKQMLAERFGISRAYVLKSIMQVHNFMLFLEKKKISFARVMESINND